jgi:hypothetical protein
MPDILDQFIIEIGLDPKKLNQGQQQALADMKKFQEEALRNAKGVEDSTRRMTDSFSSLKKEAIGVAAAFVGVTSMKDFIVTSIQAGASVGRLSRALGVSGHDIAKWQGVAAKFSSTPAEMATAFQSMSDVFTAWSVGGGEAPMVMARLAAITTAAQKLDAVHAKTFNPAKGQNQFFMDLADNLKIIHDLEKDKNLAHYLSEGIPGMNAGFFDALIRGSAELAENLREVNALTDAEIDKAGKAERAFNAASRDSTNFFRHLFFGMSNEFSKPFLDAKPWDVLFGRGNYAPDRSVPGEASGAFTSQADKEAFIRSAAAARGQNPDVWVALAKGEGFNQYKGDPDATGAATSFGAFQLHYPGIGRNTADGLGTMFTKETGLDARDPSTERRQIEWSIDYARTHGLTDWHGWHGSKFANLSGGGSTSTQTVNITGPITVTGVASPADFANKLRDVGLKRQAEANQSSVGAQ